MYRCREAGPAVLKTADFPRVSPDNLVVAVAEKQRVKVDKGNALRFHRLEDFEIVAEDEFIDGHGLFRFCFRRRCRRWRSRFFHHKRRRIVSIFMGIPIETFCID